MSSGPWGNMAMGWMEAGKKNARLGSGREVGLQRLVANLLRPCGIDGWSAVLVSEVHGTRPGLLHDLFDVGVKPCRADAARLTDIWRSGEKRALSVAPRCYYLELVWSRASAAKYIVLRRSDEGAEWRPWSRQGRLGQHDV
mmetsp:Transcript_942/g.3316  ORF Transcript_942/g.3316 Transcript_942/m.3316 type:complete len:141 (+) Transcript_942:951-1373(+)